MIQLAPELAIEFRIRDIFLSADVAAPFFEFAAQIGDAGRLLGGVVVGFAQVFRQVIKFAGVVFVMLDQLPLAFANRPRGTAPLIGVVRLMPVEPTRRRRPALREQLGQVDALEYVSGNELAGAGTVLAAITADGMLDRRATASFATAELAIADADMMTFTCRKQLIFRALLENIIDDLNGIHYTGLN